MLFKPKKESVSFSGIIRGLQQAVSSAQEMLQTQQVENFQRFFDANNKPLSQTVQVGDKTINVPLMSVVPHNSLVMENVIIRFKAKETPEAVARVLDEYNKLI
jgi:phosphoserine phosphatase